MGSRSSNFSNLNLFFVISRTWRHTEQPIFSPEESTTSPEVNNNLGIFSTAAVVMPLVPPVSKMSVASRNGAFTALI